HKGDDKLTAIANYHIKADQFGESIKNSARVEVAKADESKSLEKQGNNNTFLFVVAVFVAVLMSVCPVLGRHVALQANAPVFPAVPLGRRAVVGVARALKQSQVGVGSSVIQ